MMIPPLVKVIEVQWDQAKAFRRFTTEIGSWWPLATHSVSQGKAERVVFEERVGGRIYEVVPGGESSTWGTVKVFEPPTRVAFTWHPGREPSTAQTVEVRFTSIAGGTRVQLTHSGWEDYGDKANRARRGYSLGWGYVLRLYAGRNRSPLVLALDALTWTVKKFKR